MTATDFVREARGRKHTEENGSGEDEGGWEAEGGEGKKEGRSQYVHSPPTCALCTAGGGQRCRQSHIHLGHLRV